MAAKKALDSKTLTTTCINIVESTMQQMGNLQFSKPPESVERKIIEYHSRMRVFGMEIFNAPCYISVINYYLSDRHQKNHDSCGAFVLYIEEENAGKLLKTLGYKGLDETDPAAMSEACGELGNVLGGNFKNEMAKLSGVSLITSAPANYHNTVPEGAEFHFGEYVKYETSFHIWKQKLLAVDVTMGSIG